MVNKLDPCVPWLNIIRTWWKCSFTCRFITFGGRTDNICWVCFSNEAFRWMVLNIHISHTGRDIAMVQLGGRSGLGDNPLSVCSLSLF